jgi:hypothetical protein
LEGAKDPSDLHVKDPTQFVGAWTSAIETAVAWAVLDQERREREAATHYAVAADLLNDPDLLAKIQSVIRARGYAGELSAPTMVYLAITSRGLERPLNLAVVAPSGAGKNHAVDAALKLFPPEAVHEVTAGSARALIFTEQSFEHRTIVFGEADSIPEDGPAASVIRSIANDSHVIYETTEKNPKTGRFETRRIEKRGPTGLITTSTQSLPSQMATRVLEVSLSDDPEQTRAIMHAQALNVQPNNRSVIDLAPYVALQRWLAVAGIIAVDVPFASALADLIPAEHVRMRRDFRQLLTTVQAVAYLHQRRRLRNLQGWVIATFDDYDTARQLLSPIFDAVVGEAVTLVIRATVDAVQPRETISVTALAKRLGISKSSVHYRVHKALRGGWLTNNEQRKGHPAKLRLGEPLPAPVQALPTVDRLRKAFECSTDSGDKGTPSPSPEPGWDDDWDIDDSVSVNDEVEPDVF